MAPESARSWIPESGDVTKKPSNVAKKPKAEGGKGSGSRRIFSPSFKLQVLDSYRKDSDCQGNQRATARKYGIHRRQIQKWLQMENNLRQNATQPAVHQLPLQAVNLTRQILPPSPILETDSSCKSTGDSGISDSEEINVDEISDSEESCISDFEHSYDKALDFTCATLSKRRFHSPEFKEQVIDAFRNDVTCKGNQRATARKFGIHRRQVQKWVNKEIDYGTSEDYGCLLDLSKRKLNDAEDRDGYLAKRSKFSEDCNEVSSAQESALCLVKKKTCPPNFSEVSSTCERIVPNFPRTLADNSSLSPTYYPAYEQPWTMYASAAQDVPSFRYQIAASVGSAFESTIAYPNLYRSQGVPWHLLRSQEQASYVEVPLQYGFGDCVPTKWWLPIAEGWNNSHRITSQT